MRDTVDVIGAIACHVKAVKAESVTSSTFCTKMHSMQNSEAFNAELL